jgi:hypothetical protein
MINLNVSYNQFVFEVGTSKRFSFICLFNDLSDFSATLKAIYEKSKRFSKEDKCTNVSLYIANILFLFFF